MTGRARAWVLVVLGAWVVLGARPGLAQGALEYFARPGETTVTAPALPAGVYQVVYSLQIAAKKPVAAKTDTPDDEPDVDEGNADARDYACTVLGTLDVDLGRYASAAHRAVVPLHFAAANAPQDITLRFDNFTRQNVTASATPVRNATPKLTVNSIHLQPVPRVCLGTVWPGKILYRTAEEAHGFVAVYNGTAAAQSVTVRSTLESDLGKARPLGETAVTLQPGERKEVPVAWNTGTEEYGYALAATLTDAAGMVLDQQREYFSVADNLWKVGMTIGGIGSGVPNGPGPNESIPISQVKAAEERLAAELATPPAPVHWSYHNYTEYYAWSPDNYFVQAPEADYWYSGIGNYTMGKRWLQLAIQYMHRRGQRVTSYVLPWSGGFQADAVYRRHPDWFVYGKDGMLAWSGYQKKLEVGNAINGTDTPWPLQLAPYAQCINPNIANSAVLDAFTEQVVQSQKLFGFDGIRYDTDVFSAFGYDITGKSITNDDPKRKDALEVGAWQRVRDALWQRLGPNFVIGNNEDYELYFPHKAPAWSESCRKGCLLMEEVPRSSYDASSPRNRWRDYLAYYHGTGEIVRGLGGHHLTIAFDKMHPVDALYLNVLTYAQRAHPYGNYGVDNLPLGNYPQFVTRYSALLWDLERVKALANPEGRLAVAGSAPIWWKELACERQAPDGARQEIVHLINPPVQERIYTDPANLLPAPQTDVRVTLKTAPGETVARAWLLTAEPVTSQTVLPLTAENGAVSVTVPRLDVWSVVVFERGGGK